MTRFGGDGTLRKACKYRVCSQFQPRCPLTRSEHSDPSSVASDSSDDSEDEDDEEDTSSSDNSSDDGDDSSSDDGAQAAKLQELKTMQSRGLIAPKAYGSVRKHVIAAFAAKKSLQELQQKLTRQKLKAKSLARQLASVRQQRSKSQHARSQGSGQSLVAVPFVSGQTVEAYWAPTRAWFPATIKETVINDKGVSFTVVWKKDGTFSDNLRAERLRRPQ